MMLRILCWLTGLGPNSLSFELAHAAAKSMAEDYDRFDSELPGKP